MSWYRLRRALCDQWAPAAQLFELNRATWRNIFILLAVVILLIDLVVLSSLNDARENAWANAHFRELQIGIGVGVALCVANALLLTRRCHVPAHVKANIAIASLGVVLGAMSAAATGSTDRIFRTRTLAMSSVVRQAGPGVFGFSLPQTVFYMLWSLAVDVASQEASAIIYGDTGSLRIHCTSTVVMLAWFCVALQTSGRLRSIFDGQAALAVEKQLMETMLAMLCDASLWLCEDSRTIFGADRRFEMIMESTVTKEDVQDLVTEQERQRLQDCIQQSRSAPVLMPTTLLTKGGSHVKVELFIVGNRCGGRGSSGQAPAYLIGVRVESSGNMTQQMSTLAAGHLEVPIRAEEEEDDDDLSFGAPLSSRPETTDTGHIFNALVGTERAQQTREVDLRYGLENVLKLGRQEHWIVDPAALKVHQDQRIGSGAFGVVVPGSLHGAAVAVKMTKLVVGASAAKHVAAIANEIRILRHIRHPSIVLFHGACVSPEENELQLVMERIGGPDLSQFVRAHNTDAEVSHRFKILLDVVSALRYLHAMQPQVVHGDLKGSNILVEPAVPRAKLIDFGLSRLLTKGARKLGGSLAWMAPEIVCRKSDRPGPSADVFSFGRLSILIITCEKPLRSLRDRVIVDMARRGITQTDVWDYEKPLHFECSQLCGRTLSCEPEARPTMFQVHREASTWVLPECAQPLPDLKLVMDVQPDSMHTGVGAARSAAQEPPQRRRGHEQRQQLRERAASAPSRLGLGPGSARRAGGQPAGILDPQEGRGAGGAGQLHLAARCSL